MILVVNRANRHAFAKLLEDFHRARHEVFVEGRGWEDLRRPDGLEIDEYDRDDTVYLMAVHDGQVLAGCRYTPTTQGPILAYKLYPELFRIAPPEDERIIEITRVFVRDTGPVPNRTERTAASRRAADELLAAGPEFLRLFGCKGVVMLTEFKLVQAMLSWGCWPEPMGLPQDTPDGKLMAVVSHSTPLVAANVRQARGIDGPLLAWADSPDGKSILYADILGHDPISLHWQAPSPDAPGYRPPIELAHMSSTELADYIDKTASQPPSDPPADQGSPLAA